MGGKGVAVHTRIHCNYIVYYIVILCMYVFYVYIVISSAVCQMS